MTIFRWFLTSVIFLTGLSAAGSAESVDARFLEGLRERGLYQLAEAYCKEQLGRDDLSEVRRAELTIEMSRAITEQAVGAAPAERGPLWRKALGALDEFLEKHPASPRRILVKFQKALTFLTRGELARQEAELSGTNAGLWEEARTQLREAIGQLQGLAEEAEEKLREMNASTQRGTVPFSLRDNWDSPQNSLSAAQWDSLQKSIHYELSRALRNQALCYPAESPDRANSLTQALKLLDPLSRTEADNRLTWRSRIDRITCYRLLQDYESARAALEQFQRQKPPPEFARRGEAEAVRLALAQKDVPRALKLFKEASGDRKGTVPFSLRENWDSPQSPELELAGLEAYLAAWAAARQAGGDDQDKPWQQKADALLQRLGALYGPYWVRRGEMLVAGQVRAAPESGDLAMLVHAAENAFRSGHLDDALAVYDRASALAGKEGNQDRAFELAYTAATIEHQRNRHEQAMDRYRRMSLAHLENPKAAEAHHLAIYHAGHVLAESANKGTVPFSQRENRDSPQTGMSPDDFVKLLQEHLQRWPNDPRNDDLRRRLGGVFELRRRWPEALAAYQAITPGDPRFQEAVDAAERCCQAWCEELRAAGKPTGDAAVKAAAWFEASILTPDGRLPERFSPAARAAALAAARIRLRYTNKGAERAENILAAALQNSSDADAAWKSAVQALMIYALAQQGKTAQAREVLTQMTGSSPAAWLEVLDGLRRVAEELPEGERKPLAELQLRAIEMAEGTFTPVQRPSWERIRAQALADAGRTQEALAAHESLERQFPDDLGIVEAHAQLLLDRPDGGSQAKALTRWKTVAQKSKPGSPAWLRAQYALALIHYREGKKTEAARDIRIVELSYPELGGAELKRKYLELLRRSRE
ncbi:MAG: hypothetical protein JXB10_16205 [Pirellulales bacterium]|nr:hypothetical protein [Pirellulales bacterium]